MLRRLASLPLLLGLTVLLLLGAWAGPAGAEEQPPVREIQISTETPGRTAAMAAPAPETALGVSVLVLLAVTSVFGPWLQRRSAAELDRLQPIRVRVDR